MSTSSDPSCSAVQRNQIDPLALLSGSPVSVDAPTVVPVHVPPAGGRTWAWSNQSLVDA